MITNSFVSKIINKISLQWYSPVDALEEQDRLAQLRKFFRVVIFYFACPSMLVMALTDGVYHAQSAGQMFVLRVVSTILMSVLCLVTIRQKTLFWTQAWATLTAVCGYLPVHFMFYYRGDAESHFIFALMPALVIVATGVRFTWAFYFLNSALIVLPTVVIGMIVSDGHPGPMYFINVSNWVLNLIFCTSGRGFIEKVYAQERQLRVALKNETKEREALLLKTKEAEIAAAKRLADHARQVAHDIRSPLSALSLMTESLNEISEEKRLIVKAAATRINDIANELLSKNSRGQLGISEQENSQREVLMLPAVLDQLASEKRAQYRNHSNVRIELDLSGSYGAFVLVQKRELMRLISNLVDNAVEALPNGGVVTILAKTFQDSVQLCVSDDGIGMSPVILRRAGEMGFSHGKRANGSAGAGLGLYHAKKMVQGMGGKFEIKSQSGLGTSVEIVLNKASAPDWFLKDLNLGGIEEIVVMDDDQSIHHLWKSRFSEVLKIGSGKAIKNFVCPKEFANYAAARRFSKNCLFLIDFEMILSKESGLDLIFSLGIESQSVLVTSHWDEKLIQGQCNSGGIRLLPKALASLVPIVLNFSSDKVGA